MIESMIFVIKFLGLLLVVLFLMTFIVGIVSSWFKPVKSDKEKELEIYLTALQELKKHQEDEKSHKEQ